MDKKEVEKPAPVEPKPELAPPAVPVDAKEMAERMELAADRIEAANKAALHLRTLQEAERTNTVLEGSAVAGVPVEKKEVSDKEYADRVMAGEVPGKT